MPYSMNYIAVAVLTGFGVENADGLVNAAIVIAVGLYGLYTRYRAGGLHWTGFRK